VHGRTDKKGRKPGKKRQRENEKSKVPKVRIGTRKAPFGRSRIRHRRAPDGKKVSKYAEPQKVRPKKKNLYLKTNRVRLAAAKKTPARTQRPTFLPVFFCPFDECVKRENRTTQSSPS